MKVWLKKTEGSKHMKTHWKMEVGVVEVEEAEVEKEEGL